MIFKNRIFVLIILAASQLFAGEKPSWFEGDNKNSKGFNFFCEASVDDKSDKGERTALSAAEAECSRKMCMLFGVEVDYQQTSRENLKEAGIDSVIKESCPKVRIVGRVTRKKSVSCEDGICLAYVSQFYPISEYESEKKRLNNPAIVKELEKTIIIREGNETFKDPKVCRKVMKDFSEAHGVTKQQTDIRRKLLTQAKSDCAGLDYRNSDLQSELTGYIFANVTKRSVSFAQMANQGLMTQPNFLAKLDYLLQLESQDNEVSAAEAKKILRYNYDGLFYREFPMIGSEGYKMPGGQIVKNHPYLEELKTCDIHAEVVKKWPKNFTDDVTICMKRSGGDGEDCQSTSVIMLRASYAGCVCNLGDPARASICTGQLLSHMNADCPQQMTEQCFRSMSKRITEFMKAKMHETEGKK